MTDPAVWCVECVLEALELAQSKLPYTAAQVFRDHNIDGDCLVNQLKSQDHYDVLYETLGATSLGQKLQLNRKVKQLQAYSQQAVGHAQAGQDSSELDNPFHDPAQWTVDCVVSELCSPRSKLPATAAQAIFDHEIDGHCLVTQVINKRHYRLLYETLSITKMPQRLYLNSKIQNMKKHSQALGSHVQVNQHQDGERSPVQDPKQWDVGRVAEELCTLPPKLPLHLAQLVLDNDVDGDCLVNEVQDDDDYRELYRTLQITKLPQKLHLNLKVEEIKRRSHEPLSHKQANKKREAEDSPLRDSKRPKLESSILPRSTVDAAVQTVGSFDKTPTLRHLSQNMNGEEDTHLDMPSGEQGSSSQLGISPIHVIVSDLDQRKYQPIQCLLIPVL